MTQAPYAPWECRARPAALDGRPCGRLNDGPRYVRRFQGGEIEYCQHCGCTRRASDLRAEREAKGRQ